MALHAFPHLHTPLPTFSHLGLLLVPRLVEFGLSFGHLPLHLSHLGSKHDEETRGDERGDEGMREGGSKHDEETRGDERGDEGMREGGFKHEEGGRGDEREDERVGREEEGYGRGKG